MLSSLIIDLCKLLGMRKINTVAYHPQGNGLVENFNRTLQVMLGKHAKELALVHLGNYISSNFCLLIGLDHILLQESRHSISFMGKTQGSQLRPLFKTECVLGGCRGLLIGVDTWSGHFLKVGKAESIGKVQKQQKECYDR